MALAAMQRVMSRPSLDPNTSNVAAECLNTPLKISRLLKTE
jgi:hypothetical protein